MMSRARGLIVVAGLIAVFALGSGSTAFALGHGPAFGIATPTLGDDQWSSDTMVMAQSTDEGTVYMPREMIGYGITEDLQANLSFPLSRAINKLPHPPRTRLGTMMPSFGDVEASLMWRFQRTALGVGNRYESTLFGAFSAPTEEERGGINVGPSGTIAAVTGYASRVWYAWLGGGYQYYFPDDTERLGDLPFVSAVVGYRPPLFQEDYPKPDWRLFVEGLAEFPGRNRVNGRDDPDSGGTTVWLGPSVLGLYGKWGVGAGIIFPIHQDLNGNQPDRDWRATVNTTLWFP